MKRNNWEADWLVRVIPVEPTEEIIHEESETSEAEIQERVKKTLKDLKDSGSGVQWDR